MIRLPSGVGEGRLNVVGLKVREVPQDFLVRYVVGQDAQNISDSDAHAANPGPPATFVWLDGDSFQQFHVPEHSAAPARQHASCLLPHPA